ncbi:hypothetical protein [Microbacterium sp.]|uniref:hypothetical protein n=1 Tax=Microbacterium sp. TaxID=51671 RepID=UPI0039E4D0BF
MSERIDHAAEARRLASMIVEGDDPTIVTMQAMVNTVGAQVHATLALLEQQRIANLISLMQMQTECDENTEMLAAEAMHGLIEYVRTPATPLADPDEVAKLRPDIREGLGL